MPTLYPLRFHRILRRHIWGGRRLESSLGKPLPPGNDWSESWEIADHGTDQSTVEFGPLAGTTLRQLVGRHGRELLGRHAPQGTVPIFASAKMGLSPLPPQFPLLLKFLDGCERLSLQVHPDDVHAARLDPPDLGKTEAWFVVEAAPNSVMYVGLKAGVGRERILGAIRRSDCEDFLNVLPVVAGDCILVPAGTIHALGAGLLVAEIQQSSDTTYRLFDWNRPGPDGRPRPLRTEEGLDVVNFALGPLATAKRQPTDRPHVSRLVECDKFVWDRWDFSSSQPIGGDDRFHILTVVEGAVQIEGDAAASALPRGGVALLPASSGPVRLSPQGRTVLLDAYLP
jgi:mannose-6-phosphate isomerase